MTVLDPKLYPRTLEQPPLFGVGVHVLIGIDHEGHYSVFDQNGVKYFGPVEFGQIPKGASSIHPCFLRVNHFVDATGKEREELWCRDLMMMAMPFHKLRLTAHLQDIDLYGPSLASLIGRIGGKDEHIVKALGLWAKPVELIEDVRGFGVMLPKGTVGRIGHGAYGYAMAGMCAYDVEVPVTGLKAQGTERTIGIGYEKLRLVPKQDPT